MSLLCRNIKCHRAVVVYSLNISTAVQKQLDRSRGVRYMRRGAMPSSHLSFSPNVCAAVQKLLDSCSISGCYEFDHLLLRKLVVLISFLSVARVPS